jgi:hypothetical protein
MGIYVDGLRLQRVVTAFLILYCNLVVRKCILCPLDDISNLIRSSDGSLWHFLSVTIVYWSTRRFYLFCNKVSLSVRFVRFAVLTDFLSCIFLGSC